MDTTGPKEMNFEAAIEQWLITEGGYIWFVATRITFLLVPVSLLIPLKTITPLIWFFHSMVSL